MTCWDLSWRTLATFCACRTAVASRTWSTSRPTSLLSCTLSARTPTHRNWLPRLRTICWKVGEILCYRHTLSTDWSHSHINRTEGWLSTIDCKQTEEILDSECNWKAWRMIPTKAGHDADKTFRGKRWRRAPSITEAVISSQICIILLYKWIFFTFAGYQRELTYQHKDGSYSAFGESGGKSGSMWCVLISWFNRTTRFLYLFVCWYKAA